MCQLAVLLCIVVGHSITQPTQIRC